MTNFDKYIEEMEERRREEKHAACNAELWRRLRESSRAEAVAELYAALTFPVGVADMPKERVLEPAL